VTAPESSIDGEVKPGKENPLEQQRDAFEMVESDDRSRALLIILNHSNEVFQN
jgi:hypothetical protein